MSITRSAVGVGRVYCAVNGGFLIQNMGTHMSAFHRADSYSKRSFAPFPDFQPHSAIIMKTISGIRKATGVLHLLSAAPELLESLRPKGKP